MDELPLLLSLLAATYASLRTKKPEGWLHVDADSIQDPFFGIGAPSFCGQSAHEVFATFEEWMKHLYLREAQDVRLYSEADLFHAGLLVQFPHGRTSAWMTTPAYQLIHGDTERARRPDMNVDCTFFEVSARPAFEVMDSPLSDDLMESFMATLQKLRENILEALELSVRPSFKGKTLLENHLKDVEDLARTTDQSLPILERIIPKSNPYFSPDLKRMLAMSLRVSTQRFYSPESDSESDVEEVLLLPPEYFEMVARLRILGTQGFHAFRGQLLN